MRRRLVWITSVVASLLVLVLVAVVGATAVVTQRPIPDYDGEQVIPGLATPVEVIRDDAGVPHIYADTAEDLFRAQGYVHAQDRFFEMDFRRHVTSGRLAEWFGEDYVSTDKFIRTLGWHDVAEQEFAELEPATRGYLEAYAAGVNAYVDARSGSQLSVEYTMGLFGPPSDPDPWTPADSLAWLKAMAWDLGANMSDEVDRVLAATEVDKERVDELYPPYPESEPGQDGDDSDGADGAAAGHAPTVPGGGIEGGSFESRRADQRAGRAALPPDTVANLKRLSSTLEELPELLGTGEGLGSNAWVVDGSRTASGQPMLANDPHLGQQMPSIWHQGGLHCRERSPECPFDVSGFGFAGVPGVVIGHNDQVAWGFTNLPVDVMDVTVERVDGQSYQHEGERYPLTTRRELIQVAGRDEPVEMTVRSTRNGPILSDVDDELSDVAESAPIPESDEGGWDHEVSLQWTALEPGTTADALFQLNLAQDWKSFRGAARSFDNPAQNLLYADVEGNIGYQMPGRIPVRQSGDGRWPAAGWSGDTGWSDWIPFEELPSVRNPDEGSIVSANQAVVSSDYPHHLADVWSYGYRSERVRELLDSADELDVEAMQSIQLDDQHGFADVLVPQLLEVDLDDEFAEEGRALLRGWDGHQDVDSGAAAYFNAVWQNLLQLTFGDELPRSAWPSGGDRWYEVVRHLLDDPDNAWWDDVDTDRRETAEDMLRQAMIDARDDLTRTQAKDPERWRWGKQHTLQLRNPVLGSSGIGLVESWYNRGPLEMAGGTDAVLATSWSAAGDGYATRVVPSMRMVVDLDDLDASRWINTAGVSGHPRHEHYDDQLDLWHAGKTRPWPFSPGAVRDAGRYRLVLEPGHG